MAANPDAIPEELDNKYLFSRGISTVVDRWA